MDSQATSFIPQRPVGNKLKTRGVRKIYLLATVAYILFFSTVLAAGAVFFYKITLDKQLDIQRQALAAEKSKFSQSDIASVREMEKRLNMVKDRMDKHVSVLSILEALEHSAVEKVQYVSFEYRRPTDGAPTVTFQGNAGTFDDLIFQREVLHSNPILASAIFMNTALDTSEKRDSSGNVIQGNYQKVVTFGLHADIPASLVGYTPRNGTAAATIQPDTNTVMTQQVATDTPVAADSNATSSAVTTNSQ